MTRIVYYTSTSLDGFIADPKNSLDWLDGVEGGADSLAEGEIFASGVRAIVAGSGTYRWVLEHEHLLDNPERWHTYFGGKKMFVFTHRSDLPAVPGADIEFVEGPPARHIDRIRAVAGSRDIWLIGGGDLATQFAAAGHLDEIHLSIAPATLGAGSPLFPARLDSAQLTLVETYAIGQFIRARYRVDSRQDSVS
ncbi:dihydrofolate reductase family protein [Gryllotalpicola kribbensis]|jgi:dihydrofolate reductase|uniref:Dihydrofolate reductase family protein n=1 Tax=Gryllotalpicola kribbensis TaxID=993084 RepID=A0ABP8AUI8_9MICO